jgi:hypothetical protein
VIPVVLDGELVGLLTPDNVADLVLIREAVKNREVQTMPTPVESPIV